MIAKLKNSLTVKIFFITCLLLMFVCILTYGFIAWVMPMTYTADRNQMLTEQTERLAAQLGQSTLEDCDALLSRFAADYDAQVGIMDAGGNYIKDTFTDAFHSDEEASKQTVTVSGVKTGADGNWLNVAVDEGANVTQAIVCSFSFVSSAEIYQLMVVGNMQAVNQAAEALGHIWPWLIGAILVVSVLSSIFYAMFITRPIVRISGISRKMSAMDFSWRCKEKRSDEIGVLANSLNELAGKLSTAMTELQSANVALQADIDRERKLEQARLDFFSAVSHELKTPITVIKGQLSGMLDGVGTYADRDRYLARSLAVVRQMEGLVQELLTVSRMEKEDAALQMRPIDLTEIIQACLQEYADLFEQKEQRIDTELSAHLWVNGDPVLLAKAIRNILSNAALHSPDGAEIRIVAKMLDGAVAIQVENTGTHISQDAIPHLFEAFYRVDPSRSRQTGGSGLGLYLVKMILDKHGAACEIGNTEGGVWVELRFPML